MKIETNHKTVLTIIIILVMILTITGVLIWGFSDKIGKNTPISTTEIAEESKLSGNKYVDESIKGLKINTSNKLKETKNLNGIEIKITQLSSLNNFTTILGTLKNTTDQQIIESDIVLTVYDDMGNELAKENIGKVIPTLAANQELELNISITNDYANAYDIKFENEI